MLSTHIVARHDAHRPRQRLQPKRDLVSLLLPRVLTQTRPRRLINASRSHRALRRLDETFAPLRGPCFVTEPAKRQMSEAAFPQMLRTHPSDGPHVRANARQSKIEMEIVEVNHRQAPAAEDLRPFRGGGPAYHAVTAPLRQPLGWWSPQFALIQKHRPRSVCLQVAGDAAQNLPPINHRGFDDERDTAPS
jgi:hypothetical protein